MSRITQLSAPAVSVPGRLGPFALVVLALTWACSSEAAPDAARVVAEAAVPDDVHVVGTSELITRIADVSESADGTIWILNVAEPWFIAMSPAGSVLRSWGRAGGGPNEFRRPAALVPAPASGSIWVYDAGHHSLMRVDGSQDPIETLALRRDSIPTGRVASTETIGEGRPWIRATRSGFLLAVDRQAGDEPALWNVDLVELRHDGSMRIAFALGDRLGDPATRYGNTATEFLPYPLWTRCPDGSLALYDPLGNGIIRLSADDAVQDTIPLPPEQQLEITLDRVFRMAWSFIREQAPAGQLPDSATMYVMLEAQWDELRSEAAGVFPEYADLQCPADGTLWLQPFDPDQGQMGRGPLWLRIRPDGTSGSVRFPAAFRPLRFDSLRVLGIIRDEFDVESVAWMPLPGQ